MAPKKDIQYIIQTIKTIQVKLSNQDIIEILNTTKTVSKNKEFISRLIDLSKRMEINQNNTYLNLTSREKEILNLVGYGRQSSEIANQLQLSISTVETHRKNIRKKLNLKGKGTLLEFAILNNLEKNI